MKKLFIFTVALLLVGCTVAKSVKSRKAHRRSSTPCHKSCGWLANEMGGACMSDGRCLCWYGWTGPNSAYIDEQGKRHNRIVADYCTSKCDYTVENRNPICLLPPETVSTTVNPTTKSPEITSTTPSNGTTTSEASPPSTTSSPTTTPASTLTSTTPESSSTEEPVTMAKKTTPSTNDSSDSDYTSQDEPTSTTEAPTTPDNSVFAPGKDKDEKPEKKHLHHSTQLQGGKRFLKKHHHKHGKHFRDE
ncbi:integumentary mucin C.1-like [Hydractinia symbiolongicarpus]|uniref:integumentary mucin C.1-like n=1 Tax=Hydractinia symbiolongicarpus TaxID=13093 RepID=UPI00254E5513|nr:integumentary mucin C.1-like [Hydractinia symbiolongicarpus]